jgi:hypothetical protein
LYGNAMPVRIDCRPKPQAASRCLSAERERLPELRGSGIALVDYKHAANQIDQGHHQRPLGIWR